MKSSSSKSLNRISPKKNKSMAPSESNRASASVLLVQDPDRLTDVNTKQARLIQLLDQESADAVLLQDPSNISWFAAGADIHRSASDLSATSVFVTRDARLFATNSIDSAQIFEREAFGLGFQLKQREWFQPHDDLLQDLCRGRKVLSDAGSDFTTYAGKQIRSVRLPLTELEVQRLRTLSKVVIHSVESTARHVTTGKTEAEVAAEISHRLIKRTVAPVKISVAADGRNHRYRHWSFSEDPIQRYAVLSCTGRRWGLHVSVTRTVCLDSVPTQLWKDYQQALLVHATALYFTRHNERLCDVWKKVQRIYEKFGMTDEWKQASQASVVGHSNREVQLTPESRFRLNCPVPVFWHPSVGSAMLGDTMLCLETANEHLTHSESWPKVAVKVKGRSVECPSILRVRQSDEFDKTAALPMDASGQLTIQDDSDDQSPDEIESLWEMRTVQSLEPSDSGSA